MTEQPVAKRRRKHLGQSLSTGERMQVYDTDEAIEIDCLEGYEIERRRVFYNDVLLITISRSVNIWMVVAVVIALVIPLIIALSLLGSENGIAAVILFLTVCLPLLILLLVLLGRPEARVCIFGKRSKAKMRWTFRLARAETVYQHLIERTAEVQERDRKRIAARAPSATPFTAPTFGTIEQSPAPAASASTSAAEAAEAAATVEPPPPPPEDL